MNFVWPDSLNVVPSPLSEVELHRGLPRGEAVSEHRKVGAQKILEPRLGLECCWSRDSRYVHCSSGRTPQFRPASTGSSSRGLLALFSVRRISLTWATPRLASHCARHIYCCVCSGGVSDVCFEGAGSSPVAHRNSRDTPHMDHNGRLTKLTSMSRLAVAGTTCAVMTFNFESALRLDLYAKG
jgi:hypothetical protein